MEQRCIRQHCGWPLGDGGTHTAGTDELANDKWPGAKAPSNPKHTTHDDKFDVKGTNTTLIIKVIRC